MTPERLAQIHADSFIVPRPWSADEFRNLLAQKNPQLILHQHGFALIMLAGPEAELLTLAVDPPQRRRGFASLLMRDMESICSEHGVQDIFLEVVEQNTAARALYAGHGYTVRGARKDYYNGPKGTKVSAIVMGKSF